MFHPCLNHQHLPPDGPAITLGCLPDRLSGRLAAFETPLKAITHTTLRSAL